MKGAAKNKETGLNTTDNEHLRVLKHDINNQQKTVKSNIVSYFMW